MLTISSSIITGMETINLFKIKLNPENPRTISKEKYECLKKSITDFPEMLELAPVIIDENNMVLSGNMRIRALRDLGYKDIPVIRATGLTDMQKRELIIKTNLSFGEWDYDVLTNAWDDSKLIEWGFDFPKGYEAVETEAKRCPHCGGEL